MSDRRMFHSGRISGRAREPANRLWTTIDGYRILVLSNGTEHDAFLMAHKRRWWYIEVDRRKKDRPRPVYLHPVFGPMYDEPRTIILSHPILSQEIDRPTARTLWNASREFRKKVMTGQMSDIHIHFHPPGLDVKRFVEDMYNQIPDDDEDDDDDN